LVGPWQVTDPLQGTDFRTEDLVSAAFSFVELAASVAVHIARQPDELEETDMDTALSPPTSRRPGAARIATAATLGVAALLLVAAGIAGIVARASSDGGYVSTGTHRYASSGRAIVSDAMHVGALPDWLVASLRVKAASDKPIFVGVGRRADVDRYLAGVAHSTIEDVSYDPFDVSYSAQPGSAIPAQPASQSFWVESATGADGRAVSWKLRSGSWRVVVMNADGSRGVATDAKVGASVQGALAIVIVALVLGLALLAGAVALVIRARKT
jgi:hypothetical protein